MLGTGRPGAGRSRRRGVVGGGSGAGEARAVHHCVHPGQVATQILSQRRIDGKGGLLEVRDLAGCCRQPRGRDAEHVSRGIMQAPRGRLPDEPGAAENRDPHRVFPCRRSLAGSRHTCPQALRSLRVGAPSLCSLPAPARAECGSRASGSTSQRGRLAAPVERRSRTESRGPSLAPRRTAWRSHECQQRRSRTASRALCSRRQAMREEARPRCPYPRRPPRALRHSPAA